MRRRITTSTTISGLSTALLLAALAAGGCSSPEAETREDAAPPAAATPPAAVPGEEGPSDAEIAAIVVAANQVDIDAGELARSRAASPEVRAFAERMVTDHSAVNQQASELVAQLGVTPQENATSRQLVQGGEQNREELRAREGAEFDRAYIAQEVAYHQTVLDAIDQTLIPGADNPQLRALLEQTRPAVAAHLEHARQLQASLGGS